MSYNETLIPLADAEERIRKAFAMGLERGEAQILAGFKAVAKLNGSAEHIFGGSRIKKALPQPDRGQPLDPHELLTMAMVQVAQHYAEHDEDPTEALRKLAELADDPGGFEEVLGTAAPIAKAFGLETFIKAWDDSLHPRGDNGRFIGKDALQDAKRSPEKAKELRKKVTNPEQRAKLEKVLSGATDPGHTVRSQKRADSEERKQKRTESQAKAHRIAMNSLTGDATLEDFHELATHLPNLTVKQLRDLKQTLGATLPKNARRDMLVEALAAHVMQGPSPVEGPPEVESRGQRDANRQQLRDEWDADVAARTPEPEDVDGRAGADFGEDGAPDKPAENTVLPEDVDFGMDAMTGQEEGRPAPSTHTPAPIDSTPDEHSAVKDSTKRQLGHVREGYEQGSDVHGGAKDYAERQGRLEGGEMKQPAPSSAPAPAPTAPPSDFADDVVAAMRDIKQQRNLDSLDDIFISDMYNHLKKNPKYASMPLGEFKQKLLQSHLDNRVSLGRADLAQAVKPDTLRDSHIPHMNADFHFVKIHSTEKRNPPKLQQLATIPDAPAQTPAVSEPDGRTGTDAGTSPELSGRSPGGVGGTDGGQPVPSAGARPTPQIITARPHLARSPDLSRVPEALRQHLKPVQQEGVALALEALENHGTFLNNDGTGTGKSRQQLAVGAKYIADGKKVVLIAPNAVVKPNWAKGTLDPENSFATGAQAMGVPLHVTKAEDGLQSGKVNVTTYENLKNLLNHVDDNTVVLFDESHNLKNDDAQKTKYGKELMDKAHATMHSTATSADMPEHLAYLLKAGAMGMQSKADVYKQLGLVQRDVYNRHLGRTVSVWERQHGLKAADVAARINGFFDKMTAEGLMTRRELSLHGMDVGTEHVQLSPEDHDETEKVYNDAYAATGSKGLALARAREHQEKHKVPATVDYVKRELAAGRQPIVFLGGVNSGTDDDGEEKVATAPALRQALIDAGVPAEHIGEMHGAATKTPAQKSKAMKQFNDGKTKILLTTMQSGGTGVNLDDTEGTRPRSALLMTPPLSANDAIQAAGRIHRLNTKSDSRVHMMFSDSPVDQWNAELLARKMANMGGTTGKGSSTALNAILPEKYKDAFPADDAPAYEWQGKFATGRPVRAKTPFEHKDIIGKFGGKPKNLGTKEAPNWVSVFPNKEAHSAYLEHVKPKPAPTQPAGNASASAGSPTPTADPISVKKAGRGYVHGFPLKSGHPYWDFRKKSGAKHFSASQYGGSWEGAIWGDTPEQVRERVREAQKAGAMPHLR